MRVYIVQNMNVSINKSIIVPDFEEVWPDIWVEWSRQDQRGESQRASKKESQRDELRENRVDRICLKIYEYANL